MDPAPRPDRTSAPFSEPFALDRHRVPAESIQASAVTAGCTTTGFLAAVVVLVAAVVLPAPPGLSPAAFRMASLLVAGVLLWTTEALPIGVTALLVMILQPLLGIQALQPALMSFMSSVFFFVLAMFCIAAGLVDSGLAHRFALLLLDRAGTDSRRVVLALMAGTAAVSSVMSDVSSCAMFMAIGLTVLKRIGARPGDSRLGRAIMIGIPIASLTGGVATPAGSAINVLGLHFIEQYGQVRVTFLAWMAIGIPMVVVLIPIAWWAIVRCHPPEMAVLGALEQFREERRALGRFSLPERKTLGLLATMIVLWISSTWVPALDVTLVAVAGAVAMFAPGMRLLTWQRAERAIGWDTLLMIGGVTSLGAASVESGLATWIVEAALGGVTRWPAGLLIGATSAFTVLIHLPLPIAPVVNAVVIPPIALLALSSGQNPALYAIPVAFTASCGYLLPLEAVSLITYATGYYRMTDMLGPGALVSAAWVVWMTVLMLLLGPLLGLA